MKVNTSSVRATVAVLCAAVSLVLTLAQPASARPLAGSCSITGFHPASVTVGASPVTASFGIYTSRCAGGLKDWSLYDSSVTGAGFYVSPSGNQNTFDPNGFYNSAAGKTSVVASAYDGGFHETERTFAYGFDLRRRVAVVGGTMNASPEPVHKGGTVSITARVVVVDWDAIPLRYIPFPGHYMAVQFRTDSGTYHTVKNVVTDANGEVHTTATQSSSGLWRVAYGGTTTYGSMTISGDHVAVG